MRVRESHHSIELEHPLHIRLSRTRLEERFGTDPHMLVTLRFKSCHRYEGSIQFVPRQPAADLGQISIVDDFYVLSKYDPR